MNNRKAAFSIKAITGIDCFHVSLVTVQLVCFIRIKTDESRIAQACHVRRNINGTFKGSALLYRCRWGLRWAEREPPAHGVRVGAVDLGILDKAFSPFPSHACCREMVFQLECAATCPDRLVKKGAWAPSPEFLIPWAWGCARVFVFLTSARLLLLLLLLTMPQVQRPHYENSGVVIKSLDAGTRLSISTLLCTGCVIVGHFLNLSVPPFPYL